MDLYARRFARMSLVWLTLGAILGTHMGMTDYQQVAIRFVHVHVLLAGFMAMMVFAVGYHILPRFNAVPVAHPWLIQVHFWAANVGLAGMITFYVFGEGLGYGPYGFGFGLSGGLEALSIFLFVFNIWPVLADQKPAEEPVEIAPAPIPPAVDPVKLTAGMTVADILNRWPHLEAPMAELGLGALTDESVRESAATMVTLPMAAKRIDMDLGALIVTLENKTLLTADGPAPGSAEQPENFLSLPGGGIKRGERATGDTQIGTLLEVYPEVRDIFATRYGEACFTCPGQKTENLAQTAMMHGQPVDEVVAEINGVIEKVI